MALFPCGSANGGGGGGGTYTTTVLFTNGASGDTTFQLSSAYTNFDAIAIYYSHFDGQDQYEDVRIYPTTFLNSVSSTDDVLGFTNDVWYYNFSVYSTTEFRYVKSNAGYITDIIGIKYGSNSGGGKGTKDIYSNSETLTNKVWLGLPVYRKIFVFDEPIRVSDSWITTPADVSDLNIDYITDTIIIGKDINHPDDNVLCVTAVVNGESKKIDMAAPGYNVDVKMICIEYVKKALSEKKKSTRKSTKKEVIE